jgi:hypothetical protein
VPVLNMDKIIQFTTYITKEQRQALRSEAARLDVSVPVLLRQIINIWMERGFGESETINTSKD